MATAIDKFKDRSEAARLLAGELKYLRGTNPLILAIPRGAVAMAKVVATELEGELDILLVGKLGHPKQPEYAIGAVNEAGDIYITDQESSSFIGGEATRALAEAAVAKLKKKRQLYTPYRSAVDVTDRTCVLVDDGIATGSTFQAAIKTLKEQGAGRIIVAAPVASRQAMELLRMEGVELCILRVPAHFFSVSTHFENFDQVEDATVIALLNGEQHEVEIDLISGGFGDVILKACMHVPPRPKALVVFAHGSGSGRFSSRNQFVARRLKDAGYATLLADLLTVEESKERDLVFDTDFLAERVSAIVKWSNSDAVFNSLPIVLFGASTGAGAAIKSAAKSEVEIAAVVSRGGRVDLADEALGEVTCPMLFVVGALDALVLDLNREAMRQVKNAEVELAIIDNASHLFEEAGALSQVSELVAKWLDQHFEKVFGPSRLRSSELRARHN